MTTMLALPMTATDAQPGSLMWRQHGPFASYGAHDLDTWEIVDLGENDDVQRFEGHYPCDCLFHPLNIGHRCDRVRWMAGAAVPLSRRTALQMTSDLMAELGMSIDEAARRISGSLVREMERLPKP